MKTIHELNIDELEKLRNNYFSQLVETDPDILCSICVAEQIPMEDVKRHYEGMSFMEEDFFCNVKN